MNNPKQIPVTTGIILLNATISEGPENMLVITGHIDPATLENPTTDSYQREFLSPNTGNRSIMKALKNGDRLPQVELAVRHEDYDVLETNSLKGGCKILLPGPVYIVDGLQRISTAVLYMKKVLTSDDTYVPPLLGAVIFLNSNQSWERLRFNDTNVSRQKVSPNLLLNNWADEGDDNNPIQKIRALSSLKKQSPIYRRVCWNQRMSKGHILTALTVAKTALALHAHCVPNFGTVKRVEQISEALITLGDEISPSQIALNTSVFFSIIDKVFGVADVAYGQLNTHLRPGFLITLAKLFSDHVDFWCDQKKRDKFCEVDKVSKSLKKIGINDPGFHNLVTANSKGVSMVYSMILHSIQGSGSRSINLTRRTSVSVKNIVEILSEEENS